MSILSLETNLFMAKLETGEIVRYHACSKKGKDVYDPKVFKYIGLGEIASINHVDQKGLTDYYFYTRTDQ